MVCQFIRCIAITYWIFKRSTTILNACTKKSENLLKALRTHGITISILRKWLADSNLNPKLDCLHFLGIGLMSRVFAHGPGDWSSIPGRVIPKTKKMVLDAALFSTQLYKVHIKGKVEESGERCSPLPYTLVS